MLLEGNVGVGKTTLLRAAARGLGGDYERVEGTIDLMPQDLVYHTYIDRDGKPRVDPGPLLTHGESLSVFFFNEINRARPQVHSLLLRAMAERSLTAFNTEYRFPYLQVFADRNRVEKEETFELPGAARDRFLMEIEIAPDDSADDPPPPDLRRAFPRHRCADRRLPAAMLDHHELAGGRRGDPGRSARRRRPSRRSSIICAARRTIRARYGIALEGVDMNDLIATGASPRGMSMLVRAAKVGRVAAGRTDLSPEDLRAVFHEVDRAPRVLHADLRIAARTAGPRVHGAVLRAVPAP